MSFLFTSHFSFPMQRQSLQKHHLNTLSIIRIECLWKTNYVHLSTVHTSLRYAVVIAANTR